MPEVILTANNFESEVLNAKKPVLVDFWAPWCGPCQMMGPVIAELADTVGDSATVAKLNVDENQELAERYNVMSIPTIVFFKDGQEADRVVGVRGKDDLAKKLQELA